MVPIRKAHLAVVASLFALGATACQGGTTTTGTSTPTPTATAEAGEESPDGGRQDGRVDPCSLATSAEAKTAVGTDVKDGAAATGENQKIGCVWAATSGQNQLTIYILDETAFAAQGGNTTAKEQFDRFLRPRRNAEKLDGVGDEAFLDGNFLVFIKGSVLVEVTVITDSPTPAQKDALRSLAPTIAGRVG